MYPLGQANVRVGVHIPKVGDLWFIHCGRLCSVD